MRFDRSAKLFDNLILRFMNRSLLFVFATPAIVALVAVGQSRDQINKTLKELAARSSHATQYSWQGDVFIDARIGEGQWAPQASAKVECAMGKDGRSLLKVQPERGDEYWLMSDGKKSWAYVPSKKQYTEDQSASRPSTSADSQDDEPEEDSAASGTREQVVARQLVSHIGTLLTGAQQISLAAKPMSLKFEKEKVTWPAVQLIGKPDAEGQKSIAELAISPDRPVVGHMAWVEFHKSDSGLISLRTNVTFSAFSLGEDLPDSLFVFDPPKKAKVVEELEVPGQQLALLLHHPSPDFEARTIAGSEKVRISDLRGKVVVLNFWASWCPPCREELPAVAKLAAELKDQGVVVFGVNDEDPTTAKKYLEKQGLTLPTLDDGNQKAHRLYRVNSIPTIFLIDEQGRIAKYLKGGHDEESLRAALKSVGVGK